MKTSKIRFLFTAAIILMVVSCGGTHKEKSISVKNGNGDSFGDPSIKSMSGPDIYIGVSQLLPDEQSARNDAILHARQQVLAGLRVNITATESLKRLIVEDMTGVVTARDQFDLQTRAVAEGVLSVKPQKYYLEKYRSARGDEYKAWCMIRYSSQDHERLMNEVVGSIFESVEPLISQAESARTNQQVREAIRLVLKARESLQAVDALPSVPSYLIKKVNDLDERADKLTSGIRLLVAVREKVLGQPVSIPQFVPRLSEKLTGAGSMTITSTFNWTGIDPLQLLSNPDLQKQTGIDYSADLMLAGIAEVLEVNEKKAQFGIYSASMKAQVKLIDVSSGAVLWERALPGGDIRDTKGFANNGTDAALKALAIDQDPQAFDKLVSDMLKMMK